MRIEGEIHPIGGSAGFTREAWCRFVESRPEFRGYPTRQARNPFTGGIMDVPPMEGAKDVVVEDQVIGKVYWSMSEEPLVNVDIEPSGLPLVAEWAAALGGEFRSTNSNSASSMTYETIELDGNDAVAALMARLASFPQTGEYPFLIGGEFELQRAKELIEFDDDDPLQILQASAGVSVASWIAERRAADEEYGSPSEDLIGKWPDESVDKGAISLHRDAVSRIVKRRVFMGIARIEEPWQLPAVMRFGGWNSCPEPAVHCAFHRQWQAEYGARITGLANDTIECLVDTLPRDRDDALRLAWQQYWYCPDIVDQGCGTISRLAATLMNSQYWFFWWD